MNTELTKHNLTTLISDIKAKEELLRDKKLELETTKYIMQNIESKERLNVEGKNEKARESMLLEKLNSNPDYSVHRGSMATLLKEIESCKIEIAYLTNLLSVEKIMSRYALIEALNVRGV